MSSCSRSRRNVKSVDELDAASLDWIKPPLHKGVWMTYRNDGLLTKLVRQADIIQGVVRDTVNVSIISGAHSSSSDASLFKSDKACIRISPKCADEEEECAVYLSIQHINILGLKHLGRIHTRKYGIINKYSGIKMRLEGSHPDRKPLLSCVYKVPDGYVYELPEVYTSARMVPSSQFGIPERQGIIHRELFFNHAIISHKNKLYCVPDDNFEVFEEVINNHPECVVPLEDEEWGDANELFLREIPEGNKFKGIPFCYFPDQVAIDQLTDKFVYFQVTPKCADCGRLWANLYCVMCSEHHVQCPHVYCSEECRSKHWRRGHKNFHKSLQTENAIIEYDKREATATRSYGILPDLNLAESDRDVVEKRFVLDA